MKKHTGKWAIVVDKVGGEFYPDPAYDDLKKLESKLQYLADYQEKHNMKRVGYIAEFLTPERLAQHTAEWTKWVSMID